MHLKALLAATAIFFTTPALAINFLSINTELQAGQKAVTGHNITTVKPSSNSAEVEAYAQLIRNTRADIVGLTETADKRIAEDLASALGNNWQLIKRENRNATTGIRVTLLSRLELVENSVSNLDNQFGYSQYEKHRAQPDAMLAAGFKLDGETYYTAIGYLTAGEGDYAELRYAQADALRNALFHNCREQYNHCTLMGNFNAEPGSRAVKRAQGIDGIFGDKVALMQAEVKPGLNKKTFGEGTNARETDLILSTLYSSATLFELNPKFSGHRAVLMVSREPLEQERPSGKVKKDRKKLAAFYKQQHLEELVAKQKTYIESLELENRHLKQRLESE